MVDISGWSRGDVEGAKPATFTFPEDTLISPENFVLISRDPDTAGLNFLDTYGVAPHFAGSEIVLNNTGDVVLLTDHEGTLIDAVAYGSAALALEGWGCDSGSPNPMAGNGESIQRNPPHVDTDDCTDWDSNTRVPTPKAGPSIEE